MPERARFQAIADGMEAAAAANDDIAFMRLDRELNALLAEAAHNEYATRTMHLLNGHSRRFWYLHYKKAADLPKIARLHADEARAIAKGRPDRAAAASDKLMDYVESFTRATVGSDARAVRAGSGRTRAAG
jgi:DNA-binding GntR family transcriptional regulator